MRRQLEPLDSGNPVDVFADDLAAVTQLGSVTQLQFTARQQDTYDGKIHRTPQLRLIIPTDQLQRIGLIVTRGRLEIQQTGDTEDEPVVVH